MTHWIVQDEDILKQIPKQITRKSKILILAEVIGVESIANGLVDSLKKKGKNVILVKKKYGRQVVYPVYMEKK